MGITANSTSNTNCGMGFFLVFFSEDSETSSATSAAVTPPSSTPSLSSSLSFPSAPFLLSPTSASSRTSTARTNSNNPILTRTQSTISICALLLFLTLLLFTLSTFEPTATINGTPRRLLSNNFPRNRTRNRIKFPWSTSIFWPHDSFLSQNPISNSFALHGMGKLYRRGTRAVSDLVVGHVVEDTTEDEFRLFLRALHRSSIAARADMVFIFGSSSVASRFEGLIEEENDSFLKLLHRYKKMNFTTGDSEASEFHASWFVTHAKKEEAEPLWGKRIRVANTRQESGEDNDGGELSRLKYGSVVGFDADELDPENSLAGFLDHIPMSLRRWACYSMLLGRVRRNFNHIMLVDVKNMVLDGDPLSRVRNCNPESVYILTEEERSVKHTKMNSGKTQSSTQVNSAILMGGSRAIRRLSNAMLTEIVRTAIQQQHKKKKSSVAELEILSQLVGSRHILKNIDVIAFHPVPS